MKLLYGGYIYESNALPDVVTINGAAKPSKNSKGLPIHATEEGIKSFWNWFGSSVMVDESGRPIVFYHGNSDDFDEFQLPFERDDYDQDNYDHTDGWDGGNLGHGHYFTDDLNYAKRFGTPKEFYLKVSKLYDLTDENLINEFNTEFNDVKDELDYGVYGELVEDIMRRGGYDGVKGEGVGGFSYGASEVMIPSSKQIKAVQNTGTFDDSGNFKMESLLESKDPYTVKSIKGKMITTSIEPSKRTFKNLPRYSDKKPKVRFQDWLEMTDLKHATGKGSDGKWYGWSHRAVHGFAVGDKIKKGDIIFKGKEYTIQTEDDAKKAAFEFADAVD